MNATFRLRRTYRTEGLIGLPACLALFGLFLLFGASHSRLVEVAFIGSVPLFMAGFSAWTLLAFWRHELSIVDECLTLRGVLRAKTIDLGEVVEARWRVCRQVGSVVLKTESVRLGIDLRDYESEEQDQIVGCLRTSLRPEVQVGWNLFAFKTERWLERSRRSKPGPDEVLVRRDHYDRYLWPSVVLTALAGIITACMTANPGYLGLPLGPLVLWGLFRALTPAKGIIETKLTLPRTPETAQIVGFLAIWFLLAFVGVGVYGFMESRLAHPEAALIVGALAWVSVLFGKGFRLERRRARQAQEAADLASKGRNEPNVNLWDAD